MNKEVLYKLTRARTGMLIEFPFFGQLALRLLLVEDSSIPTLAVDGKKVYYNPDFVDKLTPELVKSAVGHEVLHCVFEHIGRRGDRNPKKWNSAGDYVINQVLEDSGFEIGENWLLNSAYAGKNADEIYNLLPEPPEGNENGPGQPGGSLDEIMDGDPTQTEIMATEWKVATIQAAIAAKSQGKLPGSLSRFVEELTNPKVDWRERLRRFVTERSKDDYTWMRPNRRFASQGLYLPSLYSENMGEIVVAIDTSGSIDQPTLNAFGAEIKSIVHSARPSNTTVIYCDARVNHVDQFGPHDELHFDMHGGGGTDFRPPFAYVDENNLHPVCFIYLTDGYGSFPEEPSFPTMWCCTTDVVAPCGETIPISV